MDLYQRIKQDLSQQKYSAGTVLKQTELAEYYQVSRIPVRDAIQRLLNEGWLCKHGKAGVAVPNFDPVEVEDIYLMRMRLEPLLLEFAFPNINNRMLGSAEDILEEIQQSKSAQTVSELNWQFHQTFYLVANRPTMLATVEKLHQQCERYIGYQSLNFDHMGQSQLEHYQLVNFIRNKELKKAQVVLVDHIQYAGEKLTQYFKLANTEKWGIKPR